MAAPEARPELTLGLAGGLLDLLFAAFCLVAELGFLGLGVQPPPALTGPRADGRVPDDVQPAGSDVSGCHCPLALCLCLLHSRRRPDRFLP